MKSSLIILVALTIIVVTFWLTEGPPETALAAELDLVTRILQGPSFPEETLPFWTFTEAGVNKGSIKIQTTILENSPSGPFFGNFPTGVTLTGEMDDPVGIAFVVPAGQGGFYDALISKKGANASEVNFDEGNSFGEGSCLTLSFGATDVMFNDELAEVQLQRGDEIANVVFDPRLKYLNFAAGGRVGQVEIRQGVFSSNLSRQDCDFNVQVYNMVGDSIVSGSFSLAAYEGGRNAIPSSQSTPDDFALGNAQSTPDDFALGNAFIISDRGCNMQHGADYSVFNFTIPEEESPGPGGLAVPTLVGSAGLAVPDLASFHVLPVAVDLDLDLNVGVAIGNPTSADFNGQALIIDFENEVLLGADTVDLPARNSDSKFAFEWVGVPAQTGVFTLIVFGNTNIGVTAINTQGGLPISSLPSGTP